MQRVWLTIKGTQSEGGSSELVEFVTEGRMFKDDDGCLLEYDESEISGSDGCTTKLLLQNGSVTLQRSGGVDTHLIFSQGSVFESNISTPYGTLHLNVLALRVESNIGDQHGNLRLEYELNMGDFSTVNKLDLSFKSMDDCIS